MPRQEILDRIKVSDKMFLFKPCVGSNKYPGIITSAEDLFPKLDVEIETSDDQACCGGFLTFTNVAQPTSTMPAVARNLALAEEKGLDTITLCNGCYTFLTEFGHFMNDRPPVKGVVNVILSMIGRKFKGSQTVYHSIEILYKLKDKVKDRTVRPLSGMKFATHYGCHYLFAFKKTAIDDPFMPSVIEELVVDMGGEIVEYPEARSCCGTGLTQVILHKEEISLPHTKTKLDSIQSVKPDAVIAVCPYCIAQLDRMQQKFNYRKIGKYETPVIHITQLIGLALGIEEKRLGFGAHAISFDKFMQKFHKLENARGVKNG
jgi:heterodisulfide reductase subunit B2